MSHLVISVSKLVKPGDFVKTVFGPNWHIVAEVDRFHGLIKVESERSADGHYFLTSDILEVRRKSSE